MSNDVRIKFDAAITEAKNARLDSTNLADDAVYTNRIERLRVERERSVGSRWTDFECPSQPGSLYPKRSS